MYRPVAILRVGIVPILFVAPVRRISNIRLIDIVIAVCVQVLCVLLLLLVM